MKTSEFYRIKTLCGTSEFNYLKQYGNTFGLDIRPRANRYSNLTEAKKALIKASNELGLFNLTIVRVIHNEERVMINSKDVQNKFRIKNKKHNNYLNRIIKNSNGFIMKFTNNKDDCFRYENYNDAFTALKLYLSKKAKYNNADGYEIKEDELITEEF